MCSGPNKRTTKITSRRLIHQTFVTTAPTPHPRWIAGTLDFRQKNPAISPTLQGTTVGRTTVICPRSLLCFTVRTVIPAIFAYKNKTPALWGWCKSKNPAHFPRCPHPHPAPGVGGRGYGYNWLVHYHEWPYSQRRAVTKLLVKHGSHYREFTGQHISDISDVTDFLLFYHSAESCTEV